MTSMKSSLARLTIALLALLQASQVQAIYCSGRFELYSYAATISPDELDDYLRPIGGSCNWAIGHDSVRNKWCDGPRCKYWYGVWISHTIDGCGCPRAWHTYDKTYWMKWTAGVQAEPFELQAKTSTDDSPKVSVEALAEASIKTPVKASSETPANTPVA